MNNVARQLGIAPATVSYHARKLGYPPKLTTRYDWPAVQAHYDSGATVKECMLKFGFSPSAWYYAVHSGRVRPRPSTTPLEELLVRQGRAHRGQLKTRIVRAGLKPSQCEGCGLFEWQGRALSLQLHHVNGDRTDNRLPNLQLLCPNCHSQTETFAGRNPRKAGAGPSPRASQ